MKAITQNILAVGILAAALPFGAPTAEAQTIINVNLFQAAAGGPAGSVTQPNVAWSAAVSPASYTGTTWNNLGFSGGALAINDSDGNAAGFLTANGSANAWSNNSPLTSLKTYWFSATSFDVKNLGAGSLWDVYVFGQDLNVSNPSYTIGAATQTYTDANDESAQLTWAENTNYTKFTSVTADALGTVNIARNAGPINGFQLVAVPEPASLALVGLGGIALLGRRRNA